MSTVLKHYRAYSKIINDMSTSTNMFILTFVPFASAEMSKRPDISYVQKIENSRILLKLAT